METASADCLLWEPSATFNARATQQAQYARVRARATAKGDASATPGIGETCASMGAPLGQGRHSSGARGEAFVGVLAPVTAAPVSKARPVSSPARVREATPSVPGTVHARVLGDAPVRRVTMAQRALLSVQEVPCIVCHF
jgi:hypothetical protein